MPVISSNEQALIFRRSGIISWLIPQDELIQAYYHGAFNKLHHKNELATFRAGSDAEHFKSFGQCLVQSLAFLRSFE
eukprot:6210861-Pleurochrysis_carterae.AAC.3